MKGPGSRIEIDVRRAWRCPTCGQNQRLTMDITAPRCFCVRDGVPMKLAEGLRPGRRDLRPELRAMLDRIQGGEEFARLSSPIVPDSEGGPRSRGRSPRPDRDERRQDGPPREPRPPETPVAAMQESVVPPAPPPTPSVPLPQPPTAADEDEFGAGLGAGESLTP